VSAFRPLVAVCLALGFAVAGCGGDDDEGDGGATTTPQPETSAQGAGKVVRVQMKDIKFIPPSVTVESGVRVVWTNDDSVPHTVTKDRGPGAEFDSGQVSSGNKFEQTFTAPGTVDYICTIHPNQDGKVTVK
jgi:plastocyanin